MARSPNRKRGTTKFTQQNFIKELHALRKRYKKLWTDSVVESLGYFAAELQSEGGWNDLFSGYFVKNTEMLNKDEPHWDEMIKEESLVNAAIGKRCKRKVKPPVSMETPKRPVGRPRKVLDV